MRLFAGRDRQPNPTALALLTAGLDIRGLLGEGEPVSAEERERIRAEYEAERCPACGCHPDEHNEY
jgi:hypothetical protein